MFLGTWNPKGNETPPNHSLNFKYHTPTSHLRDSGISSIHREHLKAPPLFPDIRAPIVKLHTMNKSFPISMFSIFIIA
jgi:hypothetical protein